MYRIVKLFKTAPNENYTGVIHMTQYVNTEDEKETGILFFTQFFKDEELNNGSFIADEGYLGLLDEDYINEEFGVKVHLSLEPGELAFFIDVGKDKFYLYDDSEFIGTYKNGDLFDSTKDQIDQDVYSEMVRNFNKIRKVVYEGSFQEKYDSLNDLHYQAEDLREMANSLDEQVVYLKKMERSDFNRKMNNK